MEPDLCKHEHPYLQTLGQVPGMVVDGITISAAAASEAFDEPLSHADALSIAKLFIV